MLVLPPNELAVVVRDNSGWRGPNLVVACAVGLGESDYRTAPYGANAHAHNRNPATGDDSYGIFMVNYHAHLRAERVALYGPPESQFDPAHNVACAYDIFVRAGHSFLPWSAYRDGGYRLYGRYEKAKAAVARLQGAGPVTLRYDRPDGSYTSHIPPGTSAMRYALRDHFGLVRTEVIRDRSRCARHGSEHCECRGIDLFTTDPVLGRRIFDFCVANAADLGVQSVIFRDREWGFGTWYERHRSKRDHFDHVHIGLTRDAAANLTRAQIEARLRGDDEMTPEQEAKLDAQEAKLDALIATVATNDERIKFLYDAIKNGSDKAATTRQVKRVAEHLGVSTES